MTWMVLPGLALTPSDYAPLAQALGADVRILDSWQVPVTGPASEIRDWLGPAHGPLTIVGHSVGGLAALEWALRFPGDIDGLVLLDPTDPHEREPTLAVDIARRLNARRVPATMLARVGPAVRQVSVAMMRRAPDRLAAAEAHKRYGEPAAAQMLMNQWIESWSQAARVRGLLAHTALPRRPVQLVGLRGGRHFLRQQRTLAHQLGARVVPVVGEGHLFPCTVPALVASIARRAMP